MPDEPDDLYDPGYYGEVVEPETLTAPSARDLGVFLATRDDVGCVLAEARDGPRGSWLIVEVEVDVGQRPAADIRRRERVAIGFSPDGRDWPWVFALRRDFPRPLPHQFIVPRGAPVSLCLSEAPWQDAKRRWTSGGFVRLLRHWLIETARGALHLDEQALEPFLPAGGPRLILPADFFERASQPGQRFFGYGLAGTESTGSPIFRLSYQPVGGVGRPLAIAPIACPVRPHGGIADVPRSLRELCGLLKTDEFDIGRALDAALEAWLADPHLHDALPVLLLFVPVARRVDVGPERPDLFAFIVGQSVRQLAVALDLWSAVGGGGRVLPSLRKAELADDQVEVGLLNPTLELSRAIAARFNGYDSPSGKKIFAVGAGSLGSQALVNLLRIGETITGVVDVDRLLPHNLVRHAVVSQGLVGRLKADVVRAQSVELYPGDPVPEVFMVDAADPSGDHVDRFRAVLGEADVILDFAASVPVSRQLCLDETSPGRRLSAFLSPGGRDLVVLAEDAARSCRLEDLEYGYYRAVIEDERLADHLDVPAGNRYARSCREVSVQLPQPHLALFSGIAAGVIRTALDTPDAVAGVWRVDPVTFGVTRVPLAVRPMRRCPVGDWLVLLAEDLLDDMRAARSARLPAETGGVLLGDFDLPRQRVYLVGMVRSPEDSREETGFFIRGSYGLQQSLQEIEQRTLSMIRYGGEWHSHPDGSPALPSEDDLDLYRHLSAEMAAEGYPAVMAILSARGLGLMIGEHFTLVSSG